MDEFALITKYFVPLAVVPEALGLCDDAALLPGPNGTQYVATADMMIAGVHFLDSDPPDLIARKLLRVNLSDLAAMGATPRYCLLTGALPHGVAEGWLAAFCDGLRQDQEAFGLMLVGGDTTATSGPLTLSLTAFGEVPEGKALLRSGARAGDALYVSGTLGDAALGLDMLQGRRTSSDDAYLIDRYRLPQPRVELGASLRGIATACIDVSDGLLADLGHVCEVSGVGAHIELERLPLSPPARACVEADPTVWGRIVAGGDDYELLFTASPGAVEALGLPATCIGRCNGSGAVTVTEYGESRAFGAEGYNHFAGIVP